MEQGSWSSPRQQQPWGGPGTQGAHGPGVQGPGTHGPGAQGPGTQGRGTYGPGTSGAAPVYGPAGPAAASGGRPWLAALVAVLTELVVIAAAFNQALTTHIENFALDRGTSFAGLSVRSFLIYRWRFSPARGDNRFGFHEWYREMLTLGVLFVLTGLLVALFVRGAVTFWKAFFGTWFTVVVATCVAVAVGSLVTKNFAPSGFAKGTAAIFYVVNGGTVFAGAALGLVVALLTALIATVSRRAAVPAAAAPAAAEAGYPAPESPPPYYGDTGSAPARDEPQWRSRPDTPSEAATTALPSVPPSVPQRDTGAEDDERTRSTVRLPRPESPGGDQSTSAYQVPPDDERR